MSVLEVSSLTKRYGSFVAVDDVSFAVERGSVFGLLGQNGSGKTTTISCALGLLRPTRGKARVLGEPARKIHRTQGRVGVVFDAPILVRGLTVRAQLSYSRRLFGHEGGRSLDDALARVGLDGLARRRVHQLSLGQQKRLAVATALAGDPELLVLDEPLSGLDPLGARDLLELFTALSREGLTIVVSSHRLNDIEPVLSHAAVVVRGRLAALGTLPELLGARGTQRVAVDDRAQARAVLRDLPGLGAIRDDGVDALLVEAGGQDSAALARALVQAGVGLRQLRPADRSLAALFESLADQARADAEASR